MPENASGGSASSSNAPDSQRESSPLSGRKSTQVTVRIYEAGSLVANLGGDAALAGKVVEHLTHLVATISPGAKKGSTAPYAYADLVFAETGTRQPRSLANAFREPAKARAADATARLTGYLSQFDGMYRAKETRRLAALADVTLPGVAARQTLDDLAQALAAEVAGA